MNLTLILNVIAVVAGFFTIGKTIQGTLQAYTNNCVRQSETFRRLEQMQLALDSLTKKIETIKMREGNLEDKFEKRCDRLDVAIAALTAKIE